MSSDSSDAASPSMPPPRDLPFASERFRILRRLGAGGMGEVYEAHDAELDARVALKTLRRHDPRALARFKNEFRALQGLEHPNLVSLGGLYEEDGLWFFTMELVRGVSFLSWVRGVGATRAPISSTPEPDVGLTPISGSLSLDEPPTARPDVEVDEGRLRDALAQLADGLGHLHDAGRIHRDVKPSNVLVRPDGRVVLLDFGLVHESHDSTDWSGSGVVGTVAYMAPEQAAGAPVTAAADWWSVGAMLYEALTGAAPHEGRPLQVLIAKQREAPPPPSARVTGVPEDLDQLCRDLLTLDPTARPNGRAVRRRVSRRTTESGERAAMSIAPAFVGRETEMEVLHEAYARVRAGEPLTVFVRGPSGLGKTALVREFTRALRDETEPPAVLRGRCYEREAVPFKGLDSVVDSIAKHLSAMPAKEAAALVPRRASLLVDTFPVLRRVDVLADAPRFRVVDPQERREQMFGAFRELLCRLGDRQPIVITIDDIQWSDQDSGRLLTELIRPPDGPRALVVATYRTSESSPEVALDLPGETIPIDLGGLHDADAIILAESAILRAGREPGEETQELAVAVARESGGHPLFIDELARRATSGDGGVHAMHLEAVLAERIARLAPNARRVLEVMSLASRPLPLATCARAADLDLAAALHELDVLRAGNLARTGGARSTDLAEPFHDRVRAATLAALSDDTVTAHHRALARAIEASDRPEPDLLVEHWAAAGDEARAREYTVQAAEQAEAALAFERAAALYARAAGFDAAFDPALETRRASALANAGRGPEAADVYLVLATELRGAERREHLRRAAYELLISGHLERGWEVVGTVLSEVGVWLPRTRFGVMLSALGSIVRLRLSGLRVRERDPDDVAPREIVMHEVLATLGRGLATVDHLLGFTFAVREALVAVRIGDPERIVPALATLSGYRANVGALGHARRIMDQAQSLAGRASENARAWVIVSVGIQEYVRGEWERSLGTLEQALQLWKDVAGAALQTNQVVTTLAGAYRNLGRLHELRGRLAEWRKTAERRGNRYLFSTLTLGYGVVPLAYESIDAAAEWAQSDRWTAAGESFHVQHWYLLRARAEIDLARGEPDLLSRHAGPLAAMGRSLLRRTLVWGLDSAWLEGRLAVADAARGDRRARRRVRRAIKRLDKGGWAHGLAMARLLEAALLRVEGDASAERVARDAIARCDALGGALYAACARMALSTWVDDPALVEAAARYAEREALPDLGRLVPVFAPGLIAPTVQER
ncbi:MAG: protein kinase [Sandaracinaceae bacterium]